MVFVYSLKTSHWHAASICHDCRIRFKEGADNEYPKEDRANHATGVNQTIASNRASDAGTGRPRRPGDYRYQSSTFLI